MTSPEITDAAVEAAATRMKARAREAGRSLTFTEAKYLAKVAIEAASEASAAFRAALTAALPHLAAGRAEAVAAPAAPSEAQDDEDRCIACDKPFKPGDMVLNDVSGGSIHIECCGPDRESYVGPGDPFPKGYAWQPAPAAEAEPVAWQWNNLGTWHTVECGPQIDAEKYVRSVAGAHGRVRPIWTAAPSPSQEATAEPVAWPNWFGWRSVDTAPEDQHVILATSGGHVGEALMLIDEDTGRQKWTWALGPVHPNHIPYGWQPMPSALTAPVASDLRPGGFDGPTGAD